MSLSKFLGKLHTLTKSKTKSCSRHVIPEFAQVDLVSYHLRGVYFLTQDIYFTSQCMRCVDTVWHRRPTARPTSRRQALGGDICPLCVTYIGDIEMNFVRKLQTM